MFKLGLAVCETRLSACAPNTAREYSFELFHIFCLNALNHGSATSVLEGPALNSFESLNMQGLKTRDDEQQWPVNCPEILFRLAFLLFSEILPKAGLTLQDF